MLVTRLGLTILCGLFFLAGFAVIPHIGIQSDEALFASPIPPQAPLPWFWIQAFKKKIPLMLMTYLGTLKTGLWALVFSVWEPSAYSTRVPALLLGMVTVPLLFQFALRASGDRSVAWFAAALLAVDPAYILTSTIDWGPVAIQHLALLGGLGLVLRSAQTGGQLAPLAAAGFAFGLGLWDKALFLWLLSAAAVAALVAFPREIWRFLSWRRLLILTVFFLLGALPLVIYNIRRPLETFRGNTQFSREDLAQKLWLLPFTANGSVLFGFLVEEDWAVANPRTSTDAFERASLALAERLGEHRHSQNWKALVLSLALSPVLLFSRFRRLTLFLLLLLSLAWVQMLATKGAGGGAHHTILLWPYPLLLIAIAFRWLTERAGPRLSRWLYPGVALLLCLSSALVMNQYIARAVRNGAPGAFTNAIFNLSERLRAYRPSRIFLVDWGFLDNLQLLQRGRLPLYWGSEPLQAESWTPEAIAGLRYMLEDGQALFLSNTDQRQIFPNVNSRLREGARMLGYQRDTLEIIYDFNGRPCFELFRFRRGSAGLPTAAPPAR